MKLIINKGGAGSGNWGHAGRQGKRGGSAPQKGIGAAMSITSGRTWPDRQLAAKRAGLVNKRRLSLSPGRVPATVSPGKAYNTVTTGQYLAPALESEKALKYMSKDIQTSIFSEANGYTSWGGATGEQRAKLKDGICADLAQRSGVSYSKVNAILGQWAETSNDNNINSLQTQRAVAAEFGMELSSWQKDKADKVDATAKHWDERYAAELQDWVGRKREYANNVLYGQHTDQYNSIDVNKAKMYTAATDAEMIEMAKRWVPYEEWIKFNAPNGAQRWDVTDDEIRKTARAMYEATQAQLAEAGFKPDDTITLFRGINPGGMPESGVKQYTGNVIESWSAGYEVALRFGHNILTMDIPVKNILATAKSGFGCITEGEFVVFGNVPKQQAVMTAKHYWVDPNNHGYKFAPETVIPEPIDFGSDLT